MPASVPLLHPALAQPPREAAASLAGAAPSTPLGPFADSAVTWTTWVTLMGFVGVTALALFAVGPAAARSDGGREAGGTLAGATARLARAGAALGTLVFPAALSDMAKSASQRGGYDYSAAWHALYDGSTAGLLAGLEFTLAPLGAALLLPLTVRRIASGPARPWLLAAALGCGTVALGTTKWPDQVTNGWGRTVFSTLMWMLHLTGGGVWLGGLAGLLLTALPGALPRTLDTAARAAFWSAAIRRFSVAAMACVAAITLSGLFLYWEHVDGPSQLFTTMYGRVLGVKILIFGALLVLGVVNQFWLHPRIEALRAAGEERPLPVVLLRRFPAVVAAEVLLGMALLFVAPFLHGSARNQAYQAHVAERTAGPVDAKQLPKLPQKQADATTWWLGTAETVAVVGLMVGGYRASGRLAAKRTAALGAADRPAKQGVPEAPGAAA